MLKKLDGDKYGHKITFGHAGYLRLFLNDKNIPEEKKNLFKKLIKEKKIEISNNGAVIDPDTVLPHYLDIVQQFRAGSEYMDNIMEGEDFVGQNTSFIIDSFGVSHGYARLMHEFGFDRMLFTRLEFTEAHYRLNAKKMDFNWKVGQNESIITQCISHHYSAPREIEKSSLVMQSNNFDIFSDNFIFPHLMFSIGDEFTGRQKETSQDRAFVFHGEDFEYRTDKYYKLIDRAISFIRSNPTPFNNSEVNYTHVDEYFTKANGFKTPSNIKTEEYDFIPYIQAPPPENQFQISKITNHKPELTKLMISKTEGWTGYFSSRPYYKNAFFGYNKFIRTISSSFARLWPQLQAFIDSKLVKSVMLDVRWVTGIFTHHDSITGVSHTNVMEDYFIKIEENQNKLINLISKDEQEKKEHEILPNFNISIWNPIFKHNSSYLSFFNPQGQKSYSLDIIEKEDLVPKIYELSDENKNHQILGDKYCSIYEKNQCFYRFELKLDTNDLINNFRLKFEKEKRKEIQLTEDRKFVNSEGKIIKISLEKESLALYIDNQFKIKISLMRYLENDHNLFNKASGPYLMYLNFQRPFKIGLISMDVYKSGPNIVIKTKTRKNYYFFITNINIEDPDTLKTEIIINPLKNDPLYKHSQDIAIRYETDIKNEREMIIDGNGIYEFKRKFGKNSEHAKNRGYTEHNTFPVTSSMRIEDTDIDNTLTKNKKKKALVIYIDRPQGANSIEEGCVDIILQRIAKGSDSKGTLIFFDEKKSIIVKHTLKFYDNFDRDRYIETKRLNNIQSSPAVGINYVKIPYLLSNLTKQSINKFKIIGNHEKSYVSDMKNGIMYYIEFRDNWKDEKPNLSLLVVNQNNFQKEIKNLDQKIYELFEITINDVKKIYEIGNIYKKLKTNKSRNKFEWKKNSNIVLKPFEMRTFIIKLK